MIPSIDSEILTSQPIDGSRSIADGFEYLRKLQKETAAWKEHGTDAKDSAKSSEGDLTVVDNLELFVEERRAFLERLFDLPEDDWKLASESESLATELYQLVLDEAEVLREIAHRLHESNLFRM